MLALRALIGSSTLLRFRPVVCVAVLLLAGCGGSSGKAIERNPVSGTVTLDGSPLDQGAIRFEPMSDVKD